MPKSRALFGQVGYWPLSADSIVGGLALDLSGQNNSGALVGAPGLVASPRGGAALSLNGSSQYVDAGTSATLKPVAKTVAAWINATALGPAYSVIVKTTDVGGTADCGIYVKSTGKLAVYLGASGGTVSYDGTGAFTLSTGIWYFVAFTYSASAGLFGYVNGAQDGFVAANGTLISVGNTFIGNDPATTGRFFGGSVAGVSIYNRPLSAGEITALYTSTTPTPGAALLRRTYYVASTGTTLTPGPGSLILTGATPTVAAGTSLTPAAGAIAMTGFAPGVAAGASVTPGAGSVALSGFAPTVSTTAADVTLTPGAGALILSGYAVTVMAASPSVLTPQSSGFDAGGFGKWFNLASGSSSPRRPKRRDSEIGRALDELVYGDDDRAALAELADEDADEAREIVADAARAIAATPVSTGALARALVAPQARAFQAVVDKSADEAWRLFLTALARQATGQRRTAIARRVAQDNADLLIVAQFVL